MPEETTSLMYSLGYIQSWINSETIGDEEVQKHLENLEQFLQAYKQF